MQEVVMVVPEDTHVDKAQHIAAKHRQQFLQRSEIRPMRHLQFQHHDRNNDRDHAIAECFQPSLAHRHSNKNI